MSELNEKIQSRAYALYVARGCKPGHAMEDWLKAETEIKSQANGSVQNAFVVEKQVKTAGKTINQPKNRQAVGLSRSR
jgi:hypothetical protein